MLKAYFLTFLTPLIFSLLSLISLSAQAVECKVGDTILAANNKLSPFFFLNEQQQNAGIVYELGSRLAELMGENVCIKGMDWAQAQDELLAGRVNALLHINPSPTRNEVLDFSTPFLASQFVYFVKRSNKEALLQTGLIDSHIGVEQSGLPYDYLTSKNKPFEVITSWESGLKRVSEDELDAVLVDRLVGFQSTLGQRIPALSVMQSNIPPSFSRIAVKKGDTELLASINVALSTLATSGEIERVMQAWVSPQIEQIEVLWFQYSEAEAFNAVLIALLIGCVLWLVYTIRRILELKHIKQLADTRQETTSNLIASLRNQHLTLHNELKTYKAATANSSQSLSLAVNGIKSGIDILKESTEQKHAQQTHEILRWLNTPLSHALAQTTNLQASNTSDDDNSQSIHSAEGDPLNVAIYLKRVLNIASPKTISFSVSPQTSLIGNTDALRLLLNCLIEITLKQLKPHMQTRIEIDYMVLNKGIQLSYRDNSSGLVNPLQLPLASLIEPENPSANLQLCSTSLASNIDLLTEHGFNIELLDRSDNISGGSSFKVLMTSVREVGNA